MPQWSWIGACSTGSSHIRSGTICQDSAGCIELAIGDEHALLAIVSDGAGSALNILQLVRALLWNALPVV